MGNGTYKIGPLIAIKTENLPGIVDAHYMRIRFTGEIYRGAVRGSAVNKSMVTSFVNIVPNNLTRIVDPGYPTRLRSIGGFY